MLLTMMVCVILFFLLQTGATAGVSAAEGIATGVAAIIAPLLAQVFKRMTGTSGFTAVIVSAIVSGAVAIGAMWFAGEIHSFGDVVKQAMAVFGLATIIYRGFTAAKTAGESS